MKIRKEDIPVILSILAGGVVAYSDFFAGHIGALVIILIFSLGWIGRKKIKDKIMAQISELAREAKDNIGIADMSKFKELVPSEVLPIVEVLQKLSEKVQEKEIQKIEYETLMEQVKELNSMKKDINKYKEEIDKMRTKMQYLQLIYDVTSKMSSALDINYLSNLIVQTIGEKLDVGNFAILLKENDVLEVKSVWGFSSNLKNLKFSPFEGVSGLAFSTGQVIYIPDTRRDGRYLYWKGEYAEDGSFLSIPLKYRDEVIGLFNFNKPKVGGFSEEEIELLKKIADQAAIAIKNAYLFEEVKNLYSSDPLTGLINRTTMIKKVEELISKNRNFTFALFDVDGLRQINMNFGYDFGDKLIVNIAKIVGSEIRSVDVASRFGGDEFAIVFLGANSKKAMDELKRISQKILNIDERVKISISGGISEFPKDGTNLKEIFESADRKLLFAKKMGGGIVLFDTNEVSV